MSAHVAIMKLCFMWRVLCLPDANIYKRVMIYILEKCVQNPPNISSESPTESIYSSVLNYGMRDSLIQCLKSRNFGDIERNKRSVKELVKEREFHRWRATCLMYENMKLYLFAVKSIEMHAWWMFSCRYPHLGNETSSVVSIMCGSQPRQFQNFTKICKLCPARIKDSAEHIFFGCEALAQTRYKYMERVLSSMPPPMRRHFEDMLITEKTMFIVSGLNVKYTDEWLVHV